MKRVFLGIAASAIVLLTSSLALPQAPASGSGQSAPEPMTNLQVFPKDTPRAQVIQTMNAFGESLGVKCDYCHEQKPSDGKFDFASDDKQEKRAARRMLLMRDSINTILPAVVEKVAGTPDTPGAPMRVLCSTCHRGTPIPKQVDLLVSEAEAGGGGAAAGLAKYKELRAQFYGGQSYDFSEGSLVWIAGRSTMAGRLDDAMKYLQANLGYFPNSSSTYQGIAQVKTLKGDKSGAIKDLEKALELDPKNMQVQEQLKRLKGQ